DEVDRLLEARPDRAELALLLLRDEEVDDRLDLARRHVGGIADRRLLAVLEIERRLLPRRRVIVLERDEALEFGIEERAVAVERPGRLGQVGEAVALQDGRHAIDLALVADELEAGAVRLEELGDVG